MDPQSRAGTGRVATRQAERRPPAAAVWRFVQTARVANYGACNPRLRVLTLRALGVHILVSAALAELARYRRVVVSRKKRVCEQRFGAGVDVFDHGQFSCRIPS